MSEAPAPPPQPPVARRQPRRRHPIVRCTLLLLWVGSVPLAIAMLGAFVFPIDLSEHAAMYLDISWVAFMVRTFAFHGAALLALGGLLSLTLRAPRLCLLTLTAAGFTALLSGVAPSGAGPVSFDRALDAARGDRPGSSLVVMTCNLWAGLTDVSRVVAEIGARDPDVIVFQEYTPLHDDRLRRALGASYAYIEADPRSDFSGQATYSRLPMRRISGRLLGPRGVAPTDPVHWERQLCCVIELTGGPDAPGPREVVLQNIHLPTAPMGRNLLEQHHRLVRELADWLKTETRPVVLAGDFNCTPMSAEAGAIRATGLTDSHRAVGGGLGATWGHRVAWPGFRIDHVYARGLVPGACIVGPDVGSDHRPVFAVLDLE